MLLVDYRAGSAELLAPLRKMGLPAESGDLAADLAWEGRGEKDVPVMVGVEFKKLGELVQSLRTQRLQGHQLLKMREHFQFCYLLVEGILHYDSQGRLLRRSGRRTFNPLPGQMDVSELFKRLLVLHLRGGLSVITTTHRRDTLQWIKALYHTWTDKALDAHDSHIAIYQPPTLVPISEFRGFFSRIDGLGLRKTIPVEQHFHGSIRRAVNASKAEWMSIDGIGDILATHITNVLEGK